ncbi:hypothetical protein WD_0297 [Wolbachia endosymbiont of Drosophila melanogaster]|nr:hypothetical protein WD_0297 [Wolbachia endosymbiont of Drosophila melanogaster]CAI5593966.1 hypothetical protein WMELPLUS_00309 [Wolbachia endosymbiont of Drosophila melanogaster]CAI5616818.1 hypothetical protein WMELCS112_00309 [Wolbachia endosymbiont of Drosophila melanogaster]CDR78717.1 hypothetical protein WPAU_0325 [Wolbachia endosymbiont of Drosophila simulans wAu]
MNNKNKSKDRKKEIEFRIDLTQKKWRERKEFFRVK